VEQDAGDPRARRRARSGPPARVLSGTAPHHELIYDDLYARIRSGQYPLNSQLPSERELAELYGVSRPTIRQTLNRAENDGLITKVPGRGNFVSRRRVSQDLSHMQTFRSVITALDMKPGYSVLAVDWIRPEPQIAARLQAPAGVRVLRVDSVGMANGQPMASYRSYLSPLAATEVHAGLEAELHAGSKSTYELAALLLGLDELRAEQTFEVTTVDDTTAKLLQLAHGASAFRVTSLFTTPAGEPVELRTAVYPGDRYSFHIRRIVPIGPGGSSGPGEADGPGGPGATGPAEG
jgi:DNA-binding GntR family transcriptional regulator